MEVQLFARAVCNHVAEGAQLMHCKNELFFNGICYGDVIEPRWRSSEGWCGARARSCQLRGER